VKYLGLILANLGRHKLRTVLTVLSVALALFLFASLRSVTTTIAATAQLGGARRLVTTNATGLVFPLPLAYGNRIKALPGVTGLSWANWFGGRYGDGKNFFAQFAVDAPSYLELYPEIILPADQKQAFLQDRTGALIGKRLLSQFGWKLGQNVTLQGTIFQGDWMFTIDGVYTTATDGVVQDNVLFFHHDYFDERIGRAGIAGWYITQIDDPAHAPTIAKSLDAMFRNSSSPTKTGTERQFQASFATMWGNVSFLMSTIGLAVVFAILLVTANAMMMSARERTGEIAVLKTVGFSDRLLFALVMVEAGAMALTGAALGLGGAKLLYPAINFNGAGFLPGFTVATSTLIIGALVAVGLMLASGLVPALRAARMPVVQALRHVE
jgi:putative ABC transport system permease protein